VGIKARIERRRLSKNPSPTRGKRHSRRNPSCHGTPDTGGEERIRVDLEDLNESSTDKRGMGGDIEKNQSKIPTASR